MTKVLIVDDEQMILRSTSALLASLGFDTLMWSEPATVPDVIRKERPDVVLQDVRMPGLDVEELVRSIDADPTTRGTRIILFSAGTDLWDIQQRVPVAGILEKPFKPQHAVAAIEQALQAPGGSVLVAPTTA